MGKKRKWSINKIQPPDFNYDMKRVLEKGKKSAGTPKV